MPVGGLVKDLMTTPALTVREDALAPEIARLMREKDVGSVIVVKADRTLAGIITEADFTGVGRCVPFSLELAPVILGLRAANLDELKRIYSQARQLTARDIMHDKVVTVRESDPIGQAVKTMMTTGHKHLPVVREGRPVGMLARHDVLKLLMD